jgi:hypothetical protein
MFHVDRKTFYRWFGFVDGGRLFHGIADGMEQKERFEVLKSACENGVEATVEKYKAKPESNDGFVWSA